MILKTETLKEKGLTQEQIDFVMAEVGKEMNAVIAERDGYKTQLETAQKSLKAREGVNVSELQGKISQLTADLNAKDGEIEKIKSDYKFDTDIQAAIKAAGARSEKAVKAFLDIDALKASKNQTADIQAAIEAVKKDNDYLFQGNQQIPKVVSVTPGINQEAQTRKEQANEALRSLFGKE